MAGIHYPAPEGKEPEDARVVAHNTRVGVVLFLIYVVLYGGFMALSAFWPQLMSKPLFRGTNLAVVYGFVLIAAALVLALIYLRVCRKSH